MLRRIRLYRQEKYVAIIRGLTIKFANSPPWACHGSSGQTPMWFDDVGIWGFHSCVVDLWQSLSERHPLLSEYVLVCHRKNVGAWIRALSVRGFYVVNNGGGTPLWEPPTVLNRRSWLPQCWTQNLGSTGARQIFLLLSVVRVRVSQAVRVTLWLMVSQSVCLGVKPCLGLMTRY
jgi:hypothetical protein